MTLSRVVATGRGRINARLVIEGLDTVFVSSARMERTADSQQRPWVNGLVLDNLTLSATADLMRAQIRGESITVTIRDLDRIAGKRHGRVTRALLARPSARAFLAADLTAAATTATLLDTSALASSGIVHINTEAIAYSGKTSTTLTGLTRAWFQTAAQAHYTADGEGVLDALVTDRPVSLEGRRAYLYLYGDGDSPTGNGSLRWRGIVSGEVVWQNGECTLQIDPITRLLEQGIGGDLGGTIGARGIKYTPSCPFVMRIIHYPSGADEVRATVEVTGIYETNEDFCATVNGQISSALAVAGISLGADARLSLQARTSSIDIVYVTDSAAPEVIGVYVHDDTDPTLGPTLLESTTSPTWWYNDSGDTETLMGDRSWAPAVSTRFHVTISAQVPRGIIGARTWWDPYRRSGSTPTPTSLEYALPLAGTVVPSVYSVLIPRTDDDEDARPLTVSSVTDRVAYLSPSTTVAQTLVYGPTTAFTLGRFISVGSVLDFATELFTTSADLANAGAMPLVLSDDVSWTQDLEDAAAAQPLALNRGFYAFEEPVTVGEFVEPELRALGAYQRISLTGGIEWARMRPPLGTDESVYALDDSSVSMAVARAPDGVLGHVVYRMGYRPREGEWDERTVTYRDVQATSPTRTPIVLEIAQRSTSAGTWRESADWETLDRTAVGRMAMAAFGLYGTPVDVVSVETDARYMDARIGDVVTISSSTMPDPEDGVSDVAERTGMVTGHSLDLASGRVVLSVLMHAQEFVGYNIAHPVSLEDPPVNTSGTTWEIAIELGTWTEATTIASLVQAGDLIVITEGDSASPTEVSGVVDSVDSATTLTVTLTGAWTVGGAEWWLRSRAAGSHDAGDNRAQYAFVSGTDARIGYADGDSETQVFT